MSLVASGVSLPAPTSARPPAPKVTSKAAGDALAAATTEAAAKAALLEIFTQGGIGIADGNGAPADQALVIVPTWELDALAKAHIDGANITLARNAKAFDTMFRWAGASAVTPATFSGFLSQWFSAPVDPREQFVTEAIEELGKQTDRPYDIAAGAPAEAPLPLLILLEESIALRGPNDPVTAATTPSGFVSTGSAGSARALAKNPCEIISGAKGDYDKVTGAYDAFDKWGQKYNPQTWEQIEQNLDNVETEASGAEAGAEGAGAAAVAVVALISAILQTALAQGYLDVKITQDPRPVVKHEKGAEPNKTKVKIVVTSKSDTPKELADCVKIVSGNGPSVDLPAAGKPISKAQVTMTTGAHFEQHLSVDYADGNYANNAGGGFGNITDANGMVSMPLQTRPQQAPQGQGKDETREGTIHVEVDLQGLGPSPSQLIAAILDHIAPWTNDFSVTVKQREIKARSIIGSAKVDAIIVGLQVDLNLKACNGFDAYITGTVGLSGGYQGGFATVASALTGLPANGSALPAVAVHVPEQEKANTDDPGLPQHGVITPLDGQLGILFISDTVAEVTVGGTPLADPATGRVFTFPVTEGAEGCPGS